MVLGKMRKYTHLGEGSSTALLRGLLGGETHPNHQVLGRSQLPDESPPMSTEIHPIKSIVDTRCIHNGRPYNIVPFFHASSFIDTPSMPASDYRWSQFNDIPVNTSSRAIDISFSIYRHHLRHLHRHLIHPTKISSIISSSRCWPC